MRTSAFRPSEKINGTVRHCQDSKMKLSVFLLCACYSFVRIITRGMYFQASKNQEGLRKDNSFPKWLAVLSMSDKVCAMTVKDAKIKKALPPQKKKLTGVCCKRRLDQVVTSTQSFPKSGLQIEISRTRTDKNRENQQRLAYSYFRLSLFLSFFCFLLVLNNRRIETENLRLLAWLNAVVLNFPQLQIIERIIEDTSVKCY